jgi:hypothetical protein
MVRYSFLVRLSHPLLHAGLSRRLLDHLIRSHHHHWWNRQAKSLGGFKVDHQLKFGWLLDWNVGWLGSFQNLIDENSGTPEGFVPVGSVGHQATILDNSSPTVNRWQPIFSAVPRSLFD